MNIIFIPVIEQLKKNKHQFIGVSWSDASPVMSALDKLTKKIRIIELGHFPWVSATPWFTVNESLNCCQIVFIHCPNTQHKPEGFTGTADIRLSQHFSQWGPGSPRCCWWSPCGSSAKRGIIYCQYNAIAEWLTILVMGFTHSL